VLPKHLDEKVARLTSTRSASSSRARPGQAAYHRRAGEGPYKSDQMLLVSPRPRRSAGRERLAGCE